MIHEKTDEIGLYYEEDKEAAFFTDAHDLVQKVHYYLEHPERRAEVQQRGYERALRDHSLDNRARTILDILDKNL
jgi:spore maturation protein CgeB